MIDKYALGGSLASETDSEVVAAVLQHFYQGDPYSAIRRTVLKLKGTFALAIMFDDQPDQIFAVRNVSPIVVAATQTVLFYLPMWRRLYPLQQIIL